MSICNNIWIADIPPVADRAWLEQYLKDLEYDHELCKEYEWAEELKEAIQYVKQLLS